MYHATGSIAVFHQLSGPCRLRSGLKRWPPVYFYFLFFLVSSWLSYQYHCTQVQYLANKHTPWWLSLQLYTFRSVPQSGHCARLLLQSSELGPLTRKQMYPPLRFLGGTHSCGRLGGRVPIRTRGQTQWYSRYICAYFVVCALIYSKHSIYSTPP
jgi:hypothetical protein